MGVYLVSAALAADSFATIKVEHKVVADWGSGYQSEVVISNDGDPFSNWVIEFDSTSLIDLIWGADIVEHIGTHYVIKNKSWNSDVTHGGTVTLGFIASPTGADGRFENCKINGVACDGSSAPPPDPEPEPDPAPDPDPDPVPDPDPDPVPDPEPDPTPEPDPEPDPSPPTVDVSFYAPNDWGTGYTGSMKIANTSAQSIEGWKLDFNLDPLTSISNLWNGNLSMDGSHATVRNASWNAAIVAGGTVEIGYTATYSGFLLTPANCSFNGTSCTFNGVPDPEPTPDPAPVPDPDPDPVPEPDPDPGPTPDPDPDPDPIPSSKRIIGYFTSWGVYGRNYHVSDIPATRLTHINYAFANVSAGGRCMLGDPYADIDKFYPGDSWDAGALRGNFNQLIKLKQQQPSLKTLISVGGWTWSGNFSDAALTAESRSSFAQSCVEYMGKYGFDGIDIDWEYPVSGGLGGNKTRPEDKQNYTLLLKEIREQLNAKEQTDGRNYLLTIASPAGPGTYSNIELSEVQKYLDWANIMTYDFHGGWSPITNFNSPLYPSSTDPSGDSTVRLKFNTSAAVEGYKANGVPVNKIVVGVPFYGRGWKGVGPGNNGLYQNHSGVPPGTWEAGMFDYDDIKENYLPTYDRYWHGEAKVPWLYNPEKGIMISYDDPQSLKEKAQYIKSESLSGVMFWELSGDDDQNSLVEALYSNLN